MTTDATTDSRCSFVTPKGKRKGRRCQRNVTGPDGLCSHHRNAVATSGQGLDLDGRTPDDGDDLGWTLLQLAWSLGVEPTTWEWASVERELVELRRRQHVLRRGMPAWRFWNVAPSPEVAKALVERWGHRGVPRRFVDRGEGEHEG